MKKLFLVLGLLVGNVAIAGEPSDLSDLGLDSLQTVSEEVGNEVRGLSASANSTGLSALTAIVYDPQTSSQFNFATNNFSTSNDENAGSASVATWALKRVLVFRHSTSTSEHSALASPLVFCSEPANRLVHRTLQSPSTCHNCVTTRSGWIEWSLDQFKKRLVLITPAFFYSLFE